MGRHGSDTVTGSLTRRASGGLAGTEPERPKAGPPPAPSPSLSPSLRRRLGRGQSQSAPAVGEREQSHQSSLPGSGAPI